jgi:hypothetical protein
LLRPLSGRTRSPSGRDDQSGDAQSTFSFGNAL